MHLRIANVKKDVIYGTTDVTITITTYKIQNYKLNSKLTNQIFIIM